jgi:DNA-binding MarR family transcriptional regulator
MKSIDQECAQKILDVIPFVLRGVDREIRQAGDPGVTRQELAILAYLQRHGEAHPTDLALRLGMSKASVSTILDQMTEQKSILWSRGTEPDRRSVRLSLTPHGRRAFESAQQRVVAAIAAHLAGLGEHDKTQLIANLDELRSAFQSVACEVKD